MATSTITLYVTDFTVDQNAKIDDLENYLANISAANKETINNFQYIKHDLSISIKVPLNQLAGTKIKYNYVKIVNSDDNLHPYYYYIINPDSVAEAVVKLDLGLDTINTFWTDVGSLWSDRTLITRQHKDRFVQKNITSGINNTLYRKVDNRPEGLGVSKLVRNSTPATVHQSDLFPQTNNLKWYLVYEARYDINDTENTSNPLKCYLYPSQSNMLFHFAGSSTSSTITAADLQPGWSYVVIYGTGNTGSIGIGGSTHALDTSYYNRCAFGINDDNEISLSWYGNDCRYTYNYTGNSITFTAPVQYVYKTNNEDVDWTSEDDWNQIVAEGKRFFIKWTGDYYIYGINTLDRTDSKIAKIIELPYMPVLITYDENNNRYNVDQNKVSFDGERMQLTSLNVNFAQEITDDANLIQTEMKTTLTAAETLEMLDVEADIKYESKLYSSELYTKKYFYDTFEKEILMEQFANNISNDTDIKIRCMFKPSNNISSKFLFKFYTTNNTYAELDNYSEYLNVNRNNELSLFNNQYLQYIRTGYNYDKKKIKEDTKANAWKFVIGTAASIVSAFKGPIGPVAAINTASSTIISGINNIKNTSMSYAELDQKLNELRNSTSSISGADDLNLLDYYNGNKLQVCSYSPYTDVKNEVWKLFHLTGYACHDYDVPNTSSRTWWNYFQCSPVFNAGFEYDKTFLDDFKQRCQVGITVFHAQNGNYDFEQTKENFETWMVI